MAIEAAAKICQQGLRKLSTRRIAARIGYSAGTLYQLFHDLDDLILHVNAKTLDGLIEACRDVDFAAGPEASLYDLADRYIGYTSRNPGLWNAVFEHSLPSGRKAPAWFIQKSRMTLLEFGGKGDSTPISASREHSSSRSPRTLGWALRHRLAGDGRQVTCSRVASTSGPVTDPQLFRRTARLQKASHIVKKKEALNA